MFVVCWLLFLVVWCVLCVVWCLLFAVCCLLFVDRWLPLLAMGGGWSSFVVRCVMFVVVLCVV